MSTFRESIEAKNEILERIGQVASAEELAEILQSLQARHPLPESEAEVADESLPMTGPAYDPLATEDELLGPTRRSDRAWGGLAAAALLLVALLGAFLWFQRPASNDEASAPPPFAPPAAPEIARAPVVEEPDAPPPAEPEIVEEMPAEEPEPAPEPERVQVADVQEPPRREEMVPAVSETRPVPMPTRRPVPSGPPAERMAGALRPGPGVEMPVPLEFPSVRFPSAARGQGIRVNVHLDLLVDEQGRVVDALVREGDTSGLGFNEAAVNAARGTRFQPATRWDLPGKAWTELIIEFEEPSGGAPITERGFG